MYGHLQGFISILDILGEGGNRHVELIGGRGFDPAPRLAPAVSSGRVVKFPLTGHQKARLFAEAPKSRVSIEH